MRRALPTAPTPRTVFVGWWRAWVCVMALLFAAPAQAQGVELTTLQLGRSDGQLTVEYSLKLKLSHALEDALQRGVPMYFNAEATLLRRRWYWRDERVARVARNWRLAYQPLTQSWRLSLGGLAQSFPTLAEALAPMTRVAGWPLAELGSLEAGERYTVEFSWKLDNAQLPQPMQIDLGTDWKLGIDRTLRVERPD